MGSAPCGVTALAYALKSANAVRAADPMAIDYSLHTHNIEAFVGAIEAGEKPEIDGIEARKAMAIIEAVYESAASGQAVTVR